MIEEFSFGNFWSFKDLQTLNLSAAKIKSSVPLLDKNNVFSIDEETHLLKSKAIYGANASGKSNVIKALMTFIRIIKESVKDDESLGLIDPFRLSTETIDQPTFFQLVFRIEDVKYRYGFEADDKSIKSEWLYFTPKVREQPLFIREGNRMLELNQKHFEEGAKFISLFEDEGEGQIFRNNSLLLSSLASFGFGKKSKKIIKAISSIAIISGLGHGGMYHLAGNSLEDSSKKKFILDFLKSADVGIENLEAVEISNDDFPNVFEDEMNEEVKKGRIIVSQRTKFDAENNSVGKSNFSFSLHESEGTKKMFELSPFIYQSLKNGSPLIIDEFDSRFHPLLTKKIVELYNSPENNGAQLIFTTHDTNLLSTELLRKDQIDFVEKDKFGASHLYTLVEIKGVRNTASFEKDYIQGKYGAIPFLGDFSSLMSFE